MQNDKWIVVLQTGGLMEDPIIKYSNYQVIAAQSKTEAEAAYNKQFNCVYYTGLALAKVIDNEKIRDNLNELGVAEIFGLLKIKAIELI